MSTGFRLIATACLSLSVLPTCSEQITPAGPEFLPASTSCTTDLGCPLGQECVDGTCVPLRQSIYPHVSTREHWVLASGPDPYRPDLTYRVLARRFSNALVLVKMLPKGSVDDTAASRLTPWTEATGCFRPTARSDWRLPRRVCATTRR